MNFEIEESWCEVLGNEFDKEYFDDLRGEAGEAYRTTKVYPTPENIFNALSLCPFNKVKVVILGQDPYHGSGQAHGLAFSVPEKVKIPPSLRNIYKEIADDIGTKIPQSGNLEHWAKQGVLLLNSTLTVSEGKPASHQKFGWETFTDTIIKTISVQKDHVVFLLWGKFAKAKANLIDESKHLILTAPHPSPLSAHRGFLGCKHFSQANLFLCKKKIRKITW